MTSTWCGCCAIGSSSCRRDASSSKGRPKRFWFRRKRNILATFWPPFPTRHSHSGCKIMPPPRESGDPRVGRFKTRFPLRGNGRWIELGTGCNDEASQIVAQRKIQTVARSRGESVACQRQAGEGKAPETRPPRKLCRRGGACARSQARAGLEKRRQDQSQGDARARGPLPGVSALRRHGAAARL